MDDDTRGQSQRTINIRHPVGVAAGEVVVDGDDVYTLACKRIQIDGKCGDKGFAFAGFHFRDVAFMQYHAADHLHVEGSKPQ